MYYIEIMINFIKVLIKTITNYLNNIFYKYFNQNNKILEFPANYDFNNPEFDMLNLIPESNNLVKTMIKFLDKYYTDQEFLVVSLSGGIDSMVLISILHKLKTKYKYKLVTATIDYSLRSESKLEAEFTKKYCDKYNIKNHLVTIDGISRKNDRTEFEEKSRNIRYNLYKELLKKYNTDMIFVAHHWDDITENVFTNFMRGKNLLDLSVMHTDSIINEVKIVRPFLDHPKKDIYKFAHQFMIPYFKDTTPDWSNRGKMRRVIFPLLENMFGKIFRKNLNDIGEHSYQIGKILDEYVFKPYIENIEHFKYGAILPILDKQNAPIIFWENILMNVFHKRGTSMPSRKSILNLIEALNNKKSDFYYPIKKGYIVYLNNKEIIIFEDFIKNISTSVTIKDNLFFENCKKCDINFKDILNGEISYITPHLEDNLIMDIINNKNIIRKINNFNLPNQLLKNLNLLTYNKSVEFNNINKYQKISIKF